MNGKRPQGIEEEKAVNLGPEDSGPGPSFPA